ncbi:MAG: hypothetical protein ACLGID_00435 [Gammaproteobacteria bacterium]
MTKDYSKGRYNVLKGRGPDAQRIGRIDQDEFVRSDKNQLLYRVDGDEFYDMAGNYIGEIDSSGDVGMVVSRTPSGITCLFMIVDE